MGAAWEGGVCGEKRASAEGVGVGAAGHVHVAQKQSLHRLGQPVQSLPFGELLTRI
jgi:hypothetical protein